MRSAKFERARLDVLPQYRFAPGPASDALTALATLAADVCDADAASVSLVDAERERPLATYGDIAPNAPREGSFGALALTHRVTIEDARLDRRTERFEAVASRAVAFFSGVPLRSAEGLAIGSLYVTAREPRPLTRVQGRRLARVAEQAQALLEAQRTIAALAGTADPDHAGEAAPDTVALRYEIDRRRNAEERLRHVVAHDDLTGLPNRPAFVDAVETLVARSRADGASAPAISLMVVGLDRFKLVNDALGQGGADALLAAVAQRLADCAPDDARVSRLGGDVFGLALDERTGLPERAVRTSHTLLDALRHPFALGAREIYVAASIGIAMLEARHATGHDALDDAETALRRAKRTGGNRHEVFSNDLCEGTVSRRELEAALAGALERDELRVHYQPIVSLEDDTVRGHEALLRWFHPAYGTILPERFVPLAEETGIIDALGRWVLSQACRTSSALDASLTGPRISVNVSALQMQSGKLISAVVDALAESQLPPQRLQLEITEAALIGLPSSAIETANRLHEMGVRFALDDFGSGYSSIGFLRHFPIETLKIDRPFVSGYREDVRSPDLVCAIVALAGKLGLDVTAEGIETPLQASTLRESGCTHGQGFFYAKPGETATLSIRAAARRRSERYRVAVS